eukprot:NODE_723_length_4789_cov_0.226439.p1 type:complete len:853 gc:universal NODE_723_length_4789_cov_0.226439:999-3557(+)
MLLDLFYHLSNEDPKIRGSAAYKLTSALEQLPTSSVGVTGHEDLDYCLKRLLKGLQSNREKARQGFGMALTELLNILHLRSYPIELPAILDLMEFENCKGHEYRDLLMGKIFGYAAICESNIFDHKGSISCDPDHLKFMFDSLINMFDKKSYFKPLLCTIMSIFVKKNQPLNSYYISKLPDSEDALSVMVSQHIDFSDISVYLHGTTGIAPILHPVYFYLVQNCPDSQLLPVWNDIEKFLNVDNRKRFLLLKLFHLVIDNYSDKFSVVIEDDKIYALMNKVLSSQSKSLKSISELILSNLKQHCTISPQVALLMCNFNQLRPYASLSGLSSEMMDLFIQNSNKLLLLNHLIKSKKYNEFKEYYSVAILNKANVLTVLKAILECSDKSKLQLLQFVFEKEGFKHTDLLESLLVSNKYAPAACLMTSFVVSHFDIFTVDRDTTDDILKACNNEDLDDANSYDVLADIYIQFMSASSSVVRQLLAIGIKDLTVNMSLVGMKMICDVLQSPLQSVVDDSEDDESLSDAMSISSHTDGSASASSRATDSDESSVDYSSAGQDFEDMIKTAVDQFNDEESDISSVDSEKMFKIDKHFELMFKQKKAAKSVDLNNQHFQSRVLDIFDGWIHVKSDPELLFTAFMALYNYRKKSLKGSTTSIKCDKIVQYMINNGTDLSLPSVPEDIEGVKELLNNLNLNGSMRLYDTVLIRFTYSIDKCKCIIQSACKKYLLNHSIKELQGLEHVFKDLILTVNDANMGCILNANMIDPSIATEILDKLFDPQVKTAKLRNKMKPLLACLRRLNKEGLLADHRLEISRIINSKTECIKKEKQQIGALKGVIYSILEATGTDKQEIVMLK